MLKEKDGDLVQINFGHERSFAITGVAAVGEPIDVEVEPAPPHDKSAHPVFNLVSLNRSDAGASAGTISFCGTVMRLNYALHGEANGGILDTGDFLHLKPHGAAALDIKVGMTVKGTGSAKPMVGGHTVIEAEEVNGVAIEKKPKPKPKKKAAHH